jgi:hypothetical protein
MATRQCKICGAETNKWMGGCTNRRCADCHRRYCTPGGNTSPGHGKNTDGVVAALDKRSDLNEHEAAFLAKWRPVYPPEK